ncbi:MAG: DUF1961 family protein [Fuerstiella sp.]|nr:DUF1961 family protein [Fuerstiella sp.]
MKTLTGFLSGVVAIVAMLTFSAAAEDETTTSKSTTQPVNPSAQQVFEHASAGSWENVFFDPGTGDWEKRWFLDGEVGRVKTGPEGMELTAGPEFRNDAHHMVLWTRDRFAGDLKIEYDFTRLDDETRCVNILYIQATGSADGPYEKDIATWNELRRVPAMRMYFDHMHAYHISYAAFPNGEDATSYIRARRYMPGASGLKGTDLKPDYYPEGLFRKGVPHRITVIKKARDLFMRIENADQIFHCHMANPDLPAVEEGRVGLRHMFTRSSRYQNFRISTLLPEDSAGRQNEQHVGHEMLVATTHQASLKAREQVLRKTIVTDSSWPPGVWGETLWALAALYLNEKVDEANAQLLRRANDYVALKRATVQTSAFKPEGATETPWAYFALTDYVRILYLFHAKSAHYPGRLNADTESAMKEALWFWVRTDSKVVDASLDNLLVLLGTENHDLTRRPNHYLVASILKDDPAYRDRPFEDGHTATEHAAAYAVFFREWPRKRAMTGLWFEVGSNTYQKYSWPALFNMHELAPDPLVRKRFGMLLDLAFIEEAQISVRGRRGGGRSRAEFGVNAFESYKNLLYASTEEPLKGASHSKVIETSRYQLPAAAILLRKREFPAREPFVIRNRVLGEQEPGQPFEGERNYYVADSALVNYAYRTPHYLLGSTLQNPALSMLNSETGQQVLRYAGISRQKRWCGMLFDDPENEDICAVYPVIEKTRGGRPQHPHWSVQHENVILLQRIAPETRKRIGSYSTGKVGIRFHGRGLQKVEESGWIFASNGKAFIGVKFLDGGYRWDETQEEAIPADFDHVTNKSRILLHSGDITNSESFAQFRANVLATRLSVSADKVKYEFGPSSSRLEVALYDGDAPEHFSLPRINGEPIDLRPPTTYQSPYLNGEFGSDQIDVTVGPLQRLLDFSR